MPVTLSAKKKLRADSRKQEVNTKVVKALKASLKKFKIAASSEALREVYSALDVAVKKRIIPKKRAARKKSRLFQLLSKRPTATKSPKKADKGKTSKTYLAKKGKNLLY